MAFGFHADLTPPEGGEGNQRKRVVFNFENGWSGSLVICASGANRCTIAAVAAWPTFNRSALELGEQEATPDEAIAFLAEIAAREAV